MECFQCDEDAQQECPRCGALYCDAHGEALCERCMDPMLALPSYRVYRGSLVALLIGSIFAVWLLVLPPVRADQDGPPSALAGVLPPRATATASPSATPTSTPEPAVTRTPTSTPSPGPTTEPDGDEDATPTPTPTPEGPIEYEVVAGDTLLAIAGRYLPPGRDLASFTSEIQELNGISDPASIQVGDVLSIPRS